jgi:DNA-directed RNA polymerase I, II, and III subunit RPABC1
MQGVCTRSMIILAWSNIRKMLAHRGYDVDFMPESVEWSYVAKTLPKSENRITLNHRTYTNRRIVVNFRTEEKIGVKAVRTLVEWMKKNQVDRAMIFSPCGATTYTSKAVEEYQPKLTIEIQFYKRFFFCLVEHELIPRHEILSPEEKQWILRVLHTEEKFFPQQLESDPVSQYYGLRKGDMICYWTNTGSQEVSPYFRVVA